MEKISGNLSMISSLKSKNSITLKKFENVFENRIEGLVWLIRHCWSLGEKVNENSLPDFLDKSAKEFLLNVNII